MKAEDWTIPALLQLSGGYWSTCALHAGVKLDLFSTLDSFALTAAEVALKSGTEERATGMLLDALSALGMIEKNNGIYTATSFAVKHLSRKSPDYLGHIIMHHHHLVTGWARLDEAVSSGGAIRGAVSHGDDEIVRESFLMGMFNLANILAPRIAQTLDLSGCRKLLDLGGGPGTYAIHFCQANPELTAVIFDLPTTRSFAENTVARFGLTDRISFEPGDFDSDPLPTGIDTAWLSHVLHSEGPASCAALLRKAVDALIPDGTLLVQEFILNDDKSGPEFPALFSLNMLLGTNGGQAYSGAELASMLIEAGLTDVERVEIDLPNGAGIVRGRKL